MKLVLIQVSENFQYVYLYRIIEYIYISDVIDHLMKIRNS